MSLAIKQYSLDMCGMWHRLVETTYSPSRILKLQTKKVGYHMTITVTVRPITPSDQRAHETVTFSRSDGLSSIT